MIALMFVFLLLIPLEIHLLILYLSGFLRRLLLLYLSRLLLLGWFLRLLDLLDFLCH